MIVRGRRRFISAASIRLRSWRNERRQTELKLRTRVVLSPGQSRDQFGFGLRPGSVLPLFDCFGEYNYQELKIESITSIVL